MSVKLVTVKEIQLYVHCSPDNTNQ